MNEEITVSFLEFVKELEQEYKYHANGGTSYRTETAKIALEVAKKTGKSTPFLHREATIQYVTTFFPHLDEERIKDVVKMLHVIAKDLHLKANLSDEMKARLKEKQLNRKSLSFLLIKDK
ncbi:hypothetical protein CVD28_02125 [Bacillus sp. M6-12]|uniref:hypothetical protein n=1 Tax=Bacillus sp. M6-12 TaxID=2054166 RepID=UPI000C77A951|nr:hypothetical protein [Bacillus sp. M6-12]PLS19229.1 hypothetical protein CVD28_02125 [Bacillus sp. M6-12]